MFFVEIRIKQCLSYISFCSLRILYNSTFILMATSLGTNSVVVTRVQCIKLPTKPLETITASRSIFSQLTDRYIWYFCCYFEIHLFNSPVTFCFIKVWLTQNKYFYNFIFSNRRSVTTFYNPVML